MKLLILVLSYTQWPFDEFMRLQQDTWDMQVNGNIDVVYYYGSCPDGYMTRWYGQELSVKCPDDYNMMHWKFKLCLDEVQYDEYDLIFRTNSCSYIVKDRILEVAAKLPHTNCYAGWQNGTYISGAGIFFSPDILDILRDELTDEPHPAEDVLIGDILHGRVDMIDDRSRTDADLTGFHTFEGYHFRAKTSNDQIGRIRDIEALKELHEKLGR